MTEARLAAAVVLEHALFVLWVGAKVTAGAWMLVANECTVASRRVQSWAVRP